MLQGTCARILFEPIYTDIQYNFVVSDSLLIEAGGITRAYVFKVSPEPYFVTAAGFNLWAHGFEYDEKLLNGSVVSLFLRNFTST
jgi:hypothetical protein